MLRSRILHSKCVTRHDKQTICKFYEALNNNRFGEFEFERISKLADMFSFSMGDIVRLNNDEK